MKKPRIPCPTCGSDRTFKKCGAYALTEWCIQQRFECQACGQKFLTMWQGELLKCYGSRPGTGTEAGVAS